MIVDVCLNVDMYLDVILFDILLIGDWLRTCFVFLNCEWLLINVWLLNCDWLLICNWLEVRGWMLICVL